MYDSIVISKKQFENPSLEFIKEKSATHEHEVIPSKDLANLKNSLESPSDEYLHDKLKVKGLKLVSNDEYNSLVNLAHKPEKSHLVEKASALGMSLIGIDAFKQIKERLTHKRITWKRKPRLLICRLLKMTSCRLYKLWLKIQILHILRKLPNKRFDCFTIV